MYGPKVHLCQFSFVTIYQRKPCKKKKKKHFLVLVWERLFVLVYLILKIKRVKDQPYIPKNLKF